MKFALIAAVDKNFGIGKNNTLPWRLPSDLKHFSAVTTNVQAPSKMNAVIMGRKTWDSLPPKSRPLKDRLNIVLSRSEQSDLPVGVQSALSLNEALQKASQPEIENIFVIGGGKIFAEAIQHPDCEKIYLTQIDTDFQCDAFFPSIDESQFEVIEKSRKMSENNLSFEFAIYQKKIKKILVERTTTEVVHPSHPAGKDGRRPQC